MAMGIRNVVAELRHHPYGDDSLQLFKDQWSSSLKDMLRYDGGEVVSHNPATGSLTVKVDNFHGQRWQSFGYRVVKVEEATGYTSKDGVYNPPEDWTWMFS